MERSHPGPRWHAAIRVSAVLLVAVLIALAQPEPVRAQATSGYGAGVFEVDGSYRVPIHLAEGGTYYLVVAASNASTYVQARLYYNGTTLQADVNESTPSAMWVSLAPGNYSLSLLGHGRAALGWDFTSGSAQDFPDNATATGFLRPATPQVNVTVSLGNVQEIHLEVYDDHLLPVTLVNVTASGTIGVDLPAAHATFAFLLASAQSGASQGSFALAWTSPSPPTPPPDVGGQILLVVLWIGVPMLLVLVAFVLLRRRNRFP